MRVMSLLPLLLIAGCVQTPPEKSVAAEHQAADDLKLARVLAGYRAEPPLSCLPLQRGQFNTQGVGNTLLYSRSRDVIYRNDTTGCRGVANGDILITQIFGAQLCRGQIAQTFDTVSRFPTGGCALGDFIPYRKIK